MLQGVLLYVQNKYLTVTELRISEESRSKTQDIQEGYKFSLRYFTD